MGRSPSKLTSPEKRTWSIKQSEKNRVPGFTDILCCQKCGRVTPDSVSARADWLVDLYRPDQTMLLVRCPQHISEWSMRNTLQGRTRKNREKAVRGRTTLSDYDLGRLGLEPMPIHARGAAGFSGVIETAPTLTVREGVTLLTKLIHQ
jgi:hypothetical protein